MTENQDKNLASMISSIMDDVTALIRGHIELAKLEIQESINNLVKSSVMFLVAVGFASLGVIFSLFAVVYGIAAAGLPVWAGFLIVALTLLVISFILVGMGRKRIEKAKTNRTVSSIVATTETLRTLRDENK